jgi:hypothetical protein
MGVVRRLVAAAAVGVGVVVVQAGVAVPASADPPPPSGGVGWHYSEESHGYYRAPGDSTSPGHGEPPKPDQDGYYWKTEIGTRVDEDGANVWDCHDTHDDDCGVVSYGCIGPFRSPQGDMRPAYPHARLRQHVSWTPNGQVDPDDEWDYVDTECVTVPDDDWVPMTEITNRIDYSVFQRLGAPKLSLNPAPRGLVNLPVVVSTNYPHGLPAPGHVTSWDPVQIEVPIDIPKPGGGLQGNILATADFTWTFEGGKQAKGRGKPYTPAVDPTKDGGYYVKDTFGEKGVKNVHLNVRWTGEVTVEGLEPEPIVPVSVDSDATITVVEAKPVLKR